VRRGGGEGRGRREGNIANRATTSASQKQRIASFLSAIVSTFKGFTTSPQ
jgi:hypothetical protein